VKSVPGDRLPRAAASNVDKRSENHESQSQAAVGLAGDESSTEEDLGGDSASEKASERESVNAHESDYISDDLPDHMDDPNEQEHFYSTHDHGEHHDRSAFANDPLLGEFQQQVVC
jgi:hypothetical protein